MADQRRKHSTALKAKVALAAVKGDLAYGDGAAAGPVTEPAIQVDRA